VEKTRHDAAVSIDLYTLFRGYGLEEDRAVKIYRHTPHRHPAARHFPNWENHAEIDVDAIYKKKLLPHFHARLASKDLGHGKDHLVGAFVAGADGATRFAGLFRILSVSKNHSSPMAKEAREWDFMKAGHVWHELEHLNSFSSLEDRLIVDWPPPAIAKSRWLVDLKGKVAQFEVLEIRAKGEFPNFPGFDSVLLNYRELEEHMKHEETSSWVKVLKSTRGVYLITDTISGQLYVGSATGEDGLWGRWRGYARSKHGGNKRIRLGIEVGELDAVNFQIGVLETLNNRASAKDGLTAEKRWKAMLGKKATTLNGN
jgi:hypothetical protein